MKFFWRSSRATAPKMRVPSRVAFGVDDDQRVAVEPHVRAVRPANGRLGADDDAAHDGALLHFAAGDGLLDGADDHVADARRSGAACRRAP